MRIFSLKILLVLFCLLTCNLSILTSKARASELSYIHTDHLGSTSLVTDEQGNVISQQVYYPYGSTRQKLKAEGLKLTAREYTGQISDQDQTGLYYYNARYYHSAIAKFTSPDTLKGGLNRYAYVSSNPLKNIDFNGNKETCVVDNAENTFMTPLNEPVNIRKERERIMHKYNIYLGSYAATYPDDPVKSDGLGLPKVARKNIIWGSIYWDKRGLRNVEEVISHFRPEIYENIGISFTDAMIGAKTKWNLKIVIRADRQRFDWTIRPSHLYHELTHIWQLKYKPNLPNFVEIAKKYGFVEERAEDEDISNGSAQFFGNNPIYDSEGNYLAANWAEAEATMVGNLADDYQYLNSPEMKKILLAPQEEWKDKYPRLYQFFLREFFLNGPINQRDKYNSN